jgi:hypothetical protein
MDHHSIIAQVRGKERKTSNPPPEYKLGLAWPIRA